MFAPSSFVSPQKFTLSSCEFFASRVVFGHSGKGNLNANKFSSIGVAGIIEEVGIDEAWPVIVITGENGVEKWLFVREWHGVSIPYPGSIGPESSCKRLLW
jgi:hypothetical protein